MNRVFISYSHTDAGFVEKIAGILSDLNIQYFRGIKNINWGEAIPSRVNEELRKSIAILVVISPGSLRSQWVPYEIGQASALGKRVLPFLTHPSIEAPLYIRHLNFVTSLEEVRSFFANFNSDLVNLASDANEELTETVVQGLQSMVDEMGREVGKLRERVSQLNLRQKDEKQRLSESILKIEKEKEELQIKAQEAMNGHLQPSSSSTMFFGGVAINAQNFRTYPVEIEVTVKTFHGGHQYGTILLE